QRSDSVWSEFGFFANQRFQILFGPRKKLRAINIFSRDRYTSIRSQRLLGDISGNLGGGSVESNTLQPFGLQKIFPIPNAFMCRQRTYPCPFFQKRNIILGDTHASFVPERPGYGERPALSYPGSFQIVTVFYK